MMPMVQSDGGCAGGGDGEDGGGGPVVQESARPVQTPVLL